MLRCTPFLLFDGDCKDAMTFYHECFGGKLTLTRLADTPMKDSFPKEKWEMLINANLKSGGIEISASDWMASPQYEPKQGDTYSIFVSGQDHDELKKVFDKLSKGAEKDRFQDLHDMPFGTYGQLTDKFGTRWIFKGDRKK